MKNRVKRNGRVYEYEYDPLIQFRPTPEMTDDLKKWDATGYDRSLLFRCLYAKFGKQVIDELPAP